VIAPCARAVLAGALAALAWSSAPPAVAPAEAGSYAAEPVTFSSGELKLRAVLARPAGDGPFPAYIHAHGSMTWEAAARPPWTRLESGSHLDVLAQHGYVVMLVARRGHRGSEGTTQTHTVRNTTGTIVTAAQVFHAAETEAADLIAAFEYVRALPYVDPERVALGGHSMGGLITVLAAAREPRLRAVVSLAGGFTWKEGNNETAWPLVERAWREAAGKIRAPVLIMWSRNDYLLEPDIGRELEKALKKQGRPVQFQLYPPFEDHGHYLFTRQKGYPVFAPDLLRFLDATLRGKAE
jgi:dienelactone hydrolase